MNDFYELDTETMSVRDLAAAVSGTPPLARDSHGFTSSGGKLYVHGGITYEGNSGSRSRIGSRFEMPE